MLAPMIGESARIAELPQIAIPTLIGPSGGHEGRAVGQPRPVRAPGSTTTMPMTLPAPVDDSCPRVMLRAQAA